MPTPRELTPEVIDKMEQMHALLETFPRPEPLSATGGEVPAFSRDDYTRWCRVTDLMAEIRKLQAEAPRLGVPS